MELILEGDLAFKHVYLRSSLGSDVTHSPEEEENSTSISSVGSTSSAATAGHVTKKSTNSRKRKEKSEDLKEYLEERDKQFLDTLKEMQN